LVTQYASIVLNERSKRNSQTPGTLILNLLKRNSGKGNMKKKIKNKGKIKGEK